MNKLLTALAATGATALLAAGPVQAARVSQQARSFMDTAARGNLAEIQAGQMMQQRATTPEVRHFAQTLVRDHSRLNQQLEQVAQRDGVRLPTRPSKEARQQMHTLEHLSGRRLDRTFVRDEVQDHQRDIRKFQHAEQTLRNPQVRQLAQQSLPVLHKHLRMAEQAESTLGQNTRRG